MGIGPDQCVGLCVARSVEMVVGILAILKAGGAYVPLDPDYPEERREFILTDARVDVVVTSEDLNPLFRSNRVVNFDFDPSRCRPESGNLENRTEPDHLAYV